MLHATTSSSSTWPLTTTVWSAMLGRYFRSRWPYTWACPKPVLVPTPLGSVDSGLCLRQIGGQSTCPHPSSMKRQHG